MATPIQILQLMPGTVQKLQKMKSGILQNPVILTPDCLHDPKIYVGNILLSCNGGGHDRRIVMGIYLARI